jgi:hypothetical protein
MTTLLGTFVPPVLPGAPANPVKAQMYYDLPTNTLYYWDGSKWESGGGGGGGGAGGHTIQDEGAALPARTSLNFTGAGVTATDDSANGRTNVTVAPPATMAARMYRSAAFTSSTTTSKIPLDGTSFDSSGMAQLSNGRIVCPVAGYYQVDAAVSWANITAVTRCIGFIYKNGVSVNQLEGDSPGGSTYPSVSIGDVIQCNAGDYLELWCYSGASIGLQTGASVYLAVSLLASLPGALGPVTPARAYRAAALTPASGWNKITLDTISADPAGNFANGRYTCPATGWYQVNAHVEWNPATSGQIYCGGVYKNGVNVAFDAITGGGGENGVGTSDVLQCNAGDYLELWAYSGNGTVGVAVAPTNTYLSVVQVGNLSSVGASTSTMAARMSRNATLAIPSGTATKVPLDTVSFDTSGMAQPANGRLIAPVAGYYLVSGECGVGGLSSAAVVVYYVYVNGVQRNVSARLQSSTDYPIASFADTLQLNAGDYVELYVWANVATNLATGGSSQDYLSLSLLTSLPGAVGPTTPARASRTGALTSTAANWNRIALDTIQFDPGGNIANGRYTAPATGTYQVNGEVAFGPITASADCMVHATIYVNGAFYSSGTVQSRSDSQGYVRASVSDVVSLKAGDYVELYSYTSGAFPLFSSGGSYNYLSVVQVGNQMATPASTVCARGYRNAAFSLSGPGWTRVPIDTVAFDTSGAVQTANGRLVAPVAGYYQVQADVALNATSSLTFSLLISIYKNGAEVSRGTESNIAMNASNGRGQNVTDIVYCNAGDYLEMYVFNSYGTLALSVGGSQFNYLSMALLTPLSGTAGPNTAARAYRNAALTLTANGFTKIPVDTVTTDPGGNIDLANGRYVCPATGTYQISVVASVFSNAPGQQIQAAARKNSAYVAYGTTDTSTATNQTLTSTVTDVVQCNAGDILELWAFCSAALAWNTGTLYGYLSVVQVGNSMNFTQAGGDLAGKYPNPIVAPPTVTALPASPVDGQQIYYLADATNGIVWHLRYRASSSSAHKWEHVGGGEVVLGPSGSIGTSSTSFVAFTGAPTYAPPLPGDYRVQWGGFVQVSVNVQLNMVFTIAKNGAPYADPQYSAQQVSTALWGGGDTSKVVRLNDLLATDVLSIMVRVNSANNGSFSNGWLNIKPVRVG